MPDSNDSIADQRRVRRVFNTKLAIVTALIIAVVAPSIYLLHRFQLTNVNRALRQRAESFREQSDYPNAIRYMDRYLRQRPDDADAKVALAELMDLNARTPQEIENTIAMLFSAIGICESSAELQSKLPNLRHRLIEQLISIGRFEDAMREIDARIGPDPQPDLIRNIARCRMGLALARRFDPSKNKVSFGDSNWFRQSISLNPVDVLLNALDSNPGDLELNRLLTEVCVRRPNLLENSKLASLSSENIDQLLLRSGERMLADNPNSSDAWLLFLEIAATFDPIAAESYFEDALTRFPDVASIERAAGLYFLRRVTNAKGSELSPTDEQTLTRAESLLRKLADSRNCRDVAVFAALGDVHSQRGNQVEAIRVWNLGCQKCQPPTLELHFRIAQTNLQSAAKDVALQSLTQLDQAIERESISISPAIQRELVRSSKELWVRYYQANRDTPAIQSLLNSLASSTTSDDSETRAETNEFIAVSYLKIGKWAKASEAFQQALANKPGDERLLRGAAQACLRSNRIAEAIVYLQLINPKNDSDWILLASAILDDQLRRSDSKTSVSNSPELDAAQEALQQARQLQTSGERVPKETWKLHLLEDEIAVRRAKPEDRQRIIESCAEEVVSLCDAAPDAPDLWQMAMGTLRRWGQLNQADRLMELFAENHPQHELSIMHRANLVAKLGTRKDGRQIIVAALRENPQSDPLVRGYLSLCDADESWPGEMEELIGKLGNDADRIASVGQFALVVPMAVPPTVSSGSVAKEKTATGNTSSDSTGSSNPNPWDQAILAIEDRLRALEGAEGIAWRNLKARRILAKSTVDRSVDLTPAREIASYLMVKQPTLGTGYAISGALADRSNQTANAMAMYQKAVMLGENDFSIHERLCELLYQEGKFDEAKALIDRLGANRNGSTRVASIALQLASDQPDQLLDIARSGIVTRPNDPMAWVWYATVLELSSRTRPADERAMSITEATDAMDRGIAVGPSDLRVINADFNFSGLTEQPERIPAIMDRLRAADTVPAVQKFVALGRMEFVRGDLDASITSYRTALDAGADPSAIAMLIAKSQQSQRKNGESIETLEGAYAKEPQHEGVRQMLASALAQRGSPADWERMQSMLVSPPFGNHASDLKLLATLSMQRGFASDLSKAKSILERLTPNPAEASGEELYRLGLVSLRGANVQLEANNTNEANWLRNEAEQYLKQSMVQDPSNREVRYVYGTLLLELQRNADALDQARQLRQLDREGFESHLLLARALNANGDASGAVGTISEWIAGERKRYSEDRFADQRVSALGRAAVGLMMVGARDRAEELLQEMEAVSPSSSRLILATLMGVDDVKLRSTALELLLGYGSAVDPNTPMAIEIGIVLARAMGGRKILEDSKKQGELFLRGLQTRHPEHLGLQRAVFDYWLLQNETDIAVECLRRVVKMTPDDPVVLNNLACLLGESVNGCSEGLQHIDRAIALVGDVPDLLDSKGTILMRMGQLEDAASIFEKAAERGQDPRIVLHWYLALKRANKFDAAKLVQQRIDRERLRRVPLNEEEIRELAALK